MSAQITIISKKYGTKTVLVDQDDLELVSVYTWYLSISPRKNHAHVFYAAASIRKPKRAKLFMHRVILSLTDPKIQVDHKNHDGLDNTRINLRICSAQQNQHNLRGYGSSGLKGVSWHKAAGRYVAQIMIGDKHKYLGLFDSAEDAHDAYVSAAKAAFGEFYHE